MLLSACQCTRAPNLFQDHSELRKATLHPWSMRDSTENGGMHWDHAQVHEPASLCIDRCQVHEDQIASEFLVSGNPLVIGDEIAAAIEDEAILIDLMRRWAKSI
jgi:hypothetical protein